MNDNIDRWWEDMLMPITERNEIELFPAQSPIETVLAIVESANEVRRDFELLRGAVRALGDYVIGCTMRHDCADDCGAVVDALKALEKGLKENDL